MKRHFLLGIIVFALSSCGSNSIESKIAGRVKAQCETPTPCIIRISDLTDFQWDEMYVFRYSASIDQIEQVIGVPVTEKLYTDHFRPERFTSAAGYVALFDRGSPTDRNSRIVTRTRS